MSMKSDYEIIIVYDALDSSSDSISESITVIVTWTVMDHCTLLENLIMKIYQLFSIESVLINVMIQ